MTYQSAEVTITATRINVPWSKQPVAIHAIDSIATQSLSSSIADVLASQAPLFLKNYGPGGIATLSQRGLGAHQTQVLWEGMELNHPMLGVVDLSLLPATVVSSISMGGSNPSSAYGSGSLGGTVYMQSSKISKGLQLRQSYSQLNNTTSQLQMGWEDEPEVWEVMLSGSYSKAQNDFQFENPITRQSEQRSHNQVISQHLLGKVKYSGDRVDWTTLAWWNRADQQIPGSVVSSSNQASQYDEFIRGLIRAQWYGWKGAWRAETGGSWVQLNYDQPQANIRSRSTSYSGKGSLQYRRYHSDQWEWKASTEFNLKHIRTNNFAVDYDRSVAAIQWQGQWNIYPKWSIYPAFRVDRYSDFGWTMSPSLGINWEIIEQQIFLFGNASRNFNAPTFNDLYWNPGGDPSIKPERSIQVELGVKWLDPQWGRHQISSYQLWIEDGIQWLPGANSVFEAQNVKNLRGYGIEWSSDLPLLTGYLQLTWLHRGTWTRTEIEEARFRDDAAVGLQLPYVPELNVKEQLLVNFWKMKLRLSGQWVSTRYTTEDHLRALDPYWNWNLAASYQIKWGANHNNNQSSKLQIHVEIKNLFNERYQVVEYYPMPGRYIKGSIQITI
ncbi:MAG: TonB-dependent receptor [Bacteroidota bacterium]